MPGAKFAVAASILHFIGGSMLWVRMRSTAANRVLVAAGIIYFLAGLALLAWLTRETWNATGPVDRLLQIALAGVVVCGVWLALNSLRNLGHPLRLQHRRR